MPTFKYTGEDEEGKNVTETVTADDRYAVYDIARQAGHKVASIEEESSLKLVRLLNIEKINYLLSRVSADELVMVTRNLGSMITAGLTLTRSLSVIQRQTDNPRLKGTIAVLVEKINNGDQFNAALKEFPETFNDMYVAMVRAGEESGRLAEALQTLAIQMERSSSLKKRIKSAMIYPAIVISIMVVIGILMMIYVMPTLLSVFENGDMELPASTKFFIALSNFINNNILLTIGGLIGLVAGVIYFLRTKIGRKIFSWTVVRLPLIGTMAKEANSAQTARTLASLLDSGVDVVQSLEITTDVIQNVYYKKVIKQARDSVEKGSALSDTFIEHSELYPILVGEMILVGEETGKISGMMGELAVFYEGEVERKTKDMSTIIEPLLMVVIGASVGFFALAVISPIYSISDGLGG
ncbi:MAG: type II secretion system F family protein [Candidatus Nomurabacteria bacterium]|nr:MAG: type II secretion system F family protein [Candidatus Nomurabacteria bacterium]